MSSRLQSAAETAARGESKGMETLSLTVDNDDTAAVADAEFSRMLNILKKEAAINGKTVVVHLVVEEEGESRRRLEENQNNQNNNNAQNNNAIMVATLKMRSCSLEELDYIIVNSIPIGKIPAYRVAEELNAYIRKKQQEQKRTKCVD